MATETAAVIAEDAAGNALAPDAITGSKPARRPPVGRHIRQWRIDRSLTVRALAESSGLNAGYLSQLENEKASPSLDTLVALAGALDIPVSWLVLDDVPVPRIVRGAERDGWVGEGGIQFTDVTGSASHDIRIVQMVGQPGIHSGLHVHDGEESHLVIRGTGRLIYGDQVIEVGPGDFVAWDGRIPHEGEFTGDEPSEVLTITLLR
jgi:transcriptional regulator with XRE-family HTH domain